MLPLAPLASLAPRTLRVVVGGGRGFVGSALPSAFLRAIRGADAYDDVEVVTVGRAPPLAAGQLHLTWEALERDGLPPCDAVVSLAGAGIVDESWTPERRAVLLSSRLDTTRALLEAVGAARTAAAVPDDAAAARRVPSVVVCASAVGIYPTSDGSLGDAEPVFDEATPLPPPDNFAAELCKAWEDLFWDRPPAAATTAAAEAGAGAAAPPAAPLAPGVRKVLVRLGIVLGAGGGALARLLPVFRFGLGGRTASGQQFFPWIALSDAAGVIAHAVLDPAVEGVLNGVQDSCTNAEFAAALGGVLGRPALIPVPEFIMKLILRERAFMLTRGQRVVPVRTVASGYTFRFPSLRSALAHELGLAPPEPEDADAATPRGPV